MSLDTSNPYGYKTPPRRQESLAGIFGRTPNDSLTPSNPNRDNRQSSVSPIRQEESPNLENKLAKTVNGTVYFRNEFSDSPYLGGRKNTNFINKSLLSSDVFANPNYEPAGSAEKRPKYRAGSLLSKKDRELSPNITKPINYSYLSPYKDPQKKETLSMVNEAGSRQGDYEDNKTPRSLLSARSNQSQSSPSKPAMNISAKNTENNQVASSTKPIEKATPEKKENKQNEGDEPLESPPKSQRGSNRQLDTQLNLRDSPQKTSARNKSAQNGHFIIGGGNGDKSQKVYRYGPGSSIRREEPPVTESPYYLKKRALNRSAVDLHAVNDGDQQTPRKRDLTPNNLRRTATAKNNLNLLTLEKQRAACDDGVRTPPLSQRSQRSQISDVSGKDLLCDVCVNTKMKEMKKENSRKDKEEARRIEQQFSRLNQKMIENENELQALKKEEGRKVALANKEAKEQREKQRSESRKNVRGEPMRHLDKIFEGEESRLRAKREKSAEFSDAVRNQILQKKMEKEKTRGAEKSPEFGTGLNVSGEYTNPRLTNRRDLSSELKRQIEEKDAKKKEEKQVFVITVDRLFINNVCSIRER